MIKNQPDREDSFHVVAIDGGAASGKSSTARLLARQCHFLHVDTGSHYRAVALACQEAGIGPEETEKLAPFLTSLTLESIIRGHESLVSFSGRKPPAEEALRSEGVNRTVSAYAAEPLVRETVKAYQRRQVEVARENGFSGVVLDGRDIGTVILPDADLKIFLIADSSTRQQRRLREGGTDVVADRDQRDASRTVAPLRAAPDAVVIDNSAIPLEEVVRLVRARLGPGGSR
ncbi:MAG: (d)CMP kinase [Oceanipulchritudo sp.]